MKGLRSASVVLLLCAPAHAQSSIEVGIVGSASNHQLSWSTRTGYNYFVDLSLDLRTWTDTGISESGTGSTVTHQFLVPGQEDLFYRIVEHIDPGNDSFLVLPVDGAAVDILDGVCFSFDLNVFGEGPPAALVIESRIHDSGDPWETIGVITDFAEIDDIRFVRGSVVWLPDLPDEYDVRVTAEDGGGGLIAEAERLLDVIPHPLPTIAIDGIVGSPPNPSAGPVYAAFLTTVNEPGSPVQRVEFYDNGALIGTDFMAPWGDAVFDVEGRDYFLLRGQHDITARAYDAHGVYGETATPLIVHVTGGNARPSLAVTSPTALVLDAGDPFTISYTVGDDDGIGDVAFVEAYDLLDPGEGVVDFGAPFQDLVIDTSDWAPGRHTVRVYAQDSAGADSYSTWLDVVIGASFAGDLIANIVDETTAAPSNGRFLGVPNSTAEFVGGFDSGLQMDAGVVMTTGSARLWNRGDEVANSWETEDPQFGQNFIEPGDPELEARIAGEATFDAAVLEFDLLCTHGQLELEYQFGSEEYPEFIGQHNDAFLIGVGGTIAAVLLPDCTDIVAVNTVNDLTPANPHLYLDNDSDIEPLIAPENLATMVEYDGMVVRLKAHFLVTPGQSYPVRLVIGDVDDEQFDSALFIETNSIGTIDLNP